MAERTSAARRLDAASAAETFQASRERLWSIAYSMLSSPDDADDIVQEAYIRWHGTDRDAVRSPEAWLVTTVTRLGIDRLRTRRVEREKYVGPWLPTPVIAVAPDTDRQAEIASELSLAFLVLLERLAPEERAAFLLREVFDVDYAKIAQVLGRSEVACRQVVHRAAARVRAERARFQPSPEEIRELAERFSAAIATDDYQRLIEILSPDASFVTDGGGKAWAARNIVTSADRVARCVLGVGRKRRAAGRIVERLAAVNGQPGVITWQDGTVIAATSFRIEDGRIVSIYRVLNPDKLREIRPQQGGEVEL
jgi:RNA polymerase sigma-70 factor, ECF subfamily